MTEYRLGSSPMIASPGFVAWGQNGYHFPEDRPSLLKIFCEGWPTVPEAALDALLKREVLQSLNGETVVFQAYVKTPPAEETREDYWEALECMPPSRFNRVNGVEMFHICEHLTDNLVNWHAAYNGKFYQFNDEADHNAADLATRIRDLAL